jgi:hypothetical protein
LGNICLEWEDPHSGCKQKFRWAVLPQGFTDSPPFFGQILQQVLEKFMLDPHMCLLHYVDDLLKSGDNQEEVINTTIGFINFLGNQGLCISKNKLQFAETEVEYLGHLISEDQRRIGPERIEGLPLLGIKQELRKFLGLVGYCHLWIDSYALKTKSLYLKLSQEGTEPLLWTPNKIKQADELKQALITIPVLALPLLNSLFTSL